MTTLGSRIRAARRALGLTQEERAVLHTLLYKILASSGEE